MSDPSKLDPGDWMAAIVAGILAGFATAFTWFTKSKERIYSKIAEQEKRMDDYEKANAIQATQLAVIHSNQDHLSRRLDEIRECGEDTNRKLDKLLMRQNGFHGGEQ